MGEAVPLVVGRRVGQPVRAGEVDDDGTGRRLERRCALVAQAAEHELRAARERLVVGDERRQAEPRQARVERVGGRAGERVGAERVQLELRVGEHAVERLLTGIPRGTEDGDGDHLRIMQIIA